MKMKLTAAIIAAFVIIMGCAGGPKASKADELDLAIRDATDYLNKNIPKGSKIVILNIQSDSAALSDYIIDELIANAVNDHIFQVVDRQQLDLIRKEQNFQWSGEVDDKHALEIGKFFGAQTIVSGKVSQVAERYRFTIRALNVQTAQVQGQNNFNIAAGKTITALMNSKGGASKSSTSGGSGTQTGTSGSGGKAAQPAAAAGPKIGTYTFYPRISPTRAGIAVKDVFIPQIDVTKDFVVIHFCRNATGSWEDEKSDTGISGFYYDKNFTLQNLDSPSQFYSPVSALSTGNGMGRIWALSYKRFNATRLKLTGKQYDRDQPFVFEEIILGEPDK